MKRIWWRFSVSFFARACLTAGTVLLLMRAVADAKPPAREPSNPVVPANTAPAPRPNVPKVLNMRDFGKSVIEVPTKQLLAAQTVPAAAPPGPVFVNPKVEPGKVRWHKDFDAACQAAKKSGKPVLLFQMMGKLDDRFC